MEILCFLKKDALFRSRKTAERTYVALARPLWRFFPYTFEHVLFSKRTWNTIFFLVSNQKNTKTLDIEPKECWNSNWCCLNSI